MWPRRILIILLGLFVGLCDATIVTWLGGSLSAMHLALPLVIILSAFSSLERALSAAIAAGLVMDALQPSFGFVTLRLLIVAGVIRAAAQTYVTNRSFAGSAALGIIGLALDAMVLWGVTWIRGWSSVPFVREMPVPVVPGVIWMLVVMTATFVVFAAFTRRFMPLVSRR
jgi:membrane-bound metal-dependent hydrolase YbcI (DUF457 family)